MFQEMMVAGSGGGADINAIEQVTLSGANNSYQDTGKSTSIVKYLYTKAASYTYWSFWKIENNTATFIDGELYAGNPLFGVDASGSTVKVAQKAVSGTLQWTNTLMESV